MHAGVGAQRHQIFGRRNAFECNGGSTGCDMCLALMQTTSDSLRALTCTHANALGHHARAVSLWRGHHCSLCSTSLACRHLGLALYASKQLRWRKTLRRVCSDPFASRQTRRSNAARSICTDATVVPQR